MSVCSKSVSGSNAGWSRETGNERRRAPDRQPRRSARLAAGDLDRRGAGPRLPRAGRARAPRSRPGSGSTRNRRWPRRAPSTAPAGRACSPGVPIGVKDVIDTVDMPTQHGSPIYRGNRPFADAACVALIRAAGGVDHGQDRHHRIRQPRSRARRSIRTTRRIRRAARRAARPPRSPISRCRSALGTQTGGSTIRPAAFCGVIGYKPSFGEFSRVGIKMQCHNLDTLGIICRSLDDVALMRGGAAGQDRAPDRPRLRRAAHRLLPHPGLGPRRCRRPRRCSSGPPRVLGGGRSHGARGDRAGPGRYSRPSPPHLRIRGGAQLRLRIRGAWRQVQRRRCATGC